MYALIGRMEVDGVSVVNDVTKARLFARWLGLARYDWASATEIDCGSGTPATMLSPPRPPSNVRIVRDN
jgi:hypothetical protein